MTMKSTGRICSRCNDAQSDGAKRTTPRPGLRPAAVALRAAQNSGLPCSSDRRAPDPSRQSADGCALWSRLETRYLRLPSPLRHNIFRQTRAPFGPHSDEDLRWRPGAPQACHFASVITNKLSEVDPQVALCQPPFQYEYLAGPQRAKGSACRSTPRAKPAPEMAEEWARKMDDHGKARGSS